MKSTISISLLALLILPAIALGQNVTPLPNVPSSQTALGTSGGASDMGQPVTDPPASYPAQRVPATAAEFDLRNKFHYYLTETYLHPSALTAPPSVRASAWRTLPAKA